MKEKWKKDPIAFLKKFEPKIHHPLGCWYWIYNTASFIQDSREDPRIIQDIQ